MSRSRIVARDAALVVRAAISPTSVGRAGFVVGKTVSKLAVTRNTVKRRLRAIIQRRGLEPGLDVILYTRPAIVGLSTHDLNRLTNHLLDIVYTAAHRQRDYSRVPAHAVTRPRPAPRGLSPRRV